MYTIGQVAERFGLSVSTLRYYDKEGLLPRLERVNGIRRFGEEDLEALRVIECLKMSGLELRDIRRFMEWCGQGRATYPQRQALFLKQKATVEAELERLRDTLAMLDYKCWYYGQAIRDGSEDRVRAMAPEELPEQIRGAYLRAHRQTGED